MKITIAGEVIKTTYEDEPLGPRAYVRWVPLEAELEVEGSQLLLTLIDESGETLVHCTFSQVEITRALRVLIEE